MGRLNVQKYLLAILIVLSAKSLLGQNIISKDGFVFVLKDSSFKLVVSEIVKLKLYDTVHVFSCFIAKDDVVTDKRQFIFGILRIHFGKTKRDASEIRMPVIDCLASGKFFFNMSNIQKQNFWKDISKLGTCEEIVGRKLLDKFKKGSAIEKVALNIDRTRPHPTQAQD